MILQKYRKKKLLKLNILNSFSFINKKLNDEHRSLHKIKRQISSGNRVLNNIKILKNNNKMLHSVDYIKKFNKNSDAEIKAVNRLNIYNYSSYFKTIENNNINNTNNISEDNNNKNKIIKLILDHLVIENKNKNIQKKLQSMELHNYNKYKKIKLEPINIKPPIFNNSISKSNKSLFERKIIYYINKNKLKKNKLKKEINDNYLAYQNTSFYSTLFKNTTVNIINNLNGESQFQNPYYSPHLMRNLWEDFQIIDNQEIETYEKSLMIKKGINDLNNNKYKRQLYYPIKIESNTDDNKKDGIYIDITKIKTKKEIENILFKSKNKLIFQNINLKKKNLKSIFPKKEKNK